MSDRGNCTSRVLCGITGHLINGRERAGALRRPETVAQRRPEAVAQRRPEAVAQRRPEAGAHL